MFLSVKKLEKRQKECVNVEHVRESRLRVKLSPIQNRATGKTSGHRRFFLTSFEVKLNGHGKRGWGDKTGVAPRIGAPFGSIIKRTILNPRYFEIFVMHLAECCAIAFCSRGERRECAREHQHANGKAGKMCKRFVLVHVRNR